MATLQSYKERMPVIYQTRYEDTYWICWANALLERLSGVGLIPPQRRSETAEVYDGVWLDRPDGCRNVREIRRPGNTAPQFRFVEEDGRIRLLGVTTPDGEELTVIYMAAFNPIETMEDELHLGMTYENLADTWFRWKVEEQVSSISSECQYWGNRFAEEIRRIRAEASSRTNVSRGRTLAGFK
ncbi:MAG: hypothetical protein LBU70_04965 [Chitinispirillales bacterium]|jgi:hypothetical protein|nr:hypothetical protein [Chitinispirillales bacterium]